MLDIPASLEGGKGDHLPALKGPLSTASTITENFLLEYTSGLPMDQVGWGRVDIATLRELLALHTAASDLGRRSSYLATAQASNALAHILDTLQQAVTGKEVPGALGKLGDYAVILVGHDTNLANIAGTLNLNWLVDGRRDDTPPGGALVFELWEQPGTSTYEVRASHCADSGPDAQPHCAHVGESSGKVECLYSRLQHRRGWIPLRLEGFSTNPDEGNRSHFCEVVAGPGT